MPNSEDFLRPDPGGEYSIFWGYTLSSLLSVIGSVSVCLTGFLFPSMVKNKIFSKMIIAMSFLNLIQASAGMFGYPVNDTSCIIQGVMANFGAKGSWLFSVVIGYQLRHQLNHGTIALSMRSIMLLFSAVQLFSLLMPFLYKPGGYGNYETTYYSFKGGIQCLIYSDDLENWYDATFINWTVWVFVTIFGLFVNSALLLLDAPALKAKLSGEAYAKAAQLRSSSHIYLYIVMIVYIPLAIANSVLYFDLIRTGHFTHPKEREILWVQITSAWGNLDGFWTGIAYFYYGEEARRRWSALLGKYILGQCWLFVADKVKKGFVYVFCGPAMKMMCAKAIDPSEKADDDDFADNDEVRDGSFNAMGKSSAANSDADRADAAPNPLPSKKRPSRNANANTSVSPLHVLNEGSVKDLDGIEVEESQDVMDDDDFQRLVRGAYAENDVTRNSIQVLDVVESRTSLGNWIMSAIEGSSNTTASNKNGISTANRSARNLDIDRGVSPTSTPQEL